MPYQCILTVMINTIKALCKSQKTPPTNNLLFSDVYNNNNNNNNNRVHRSLGT